MLMLMLLLMRSCLYRKLKHCENCNQNRNRGKRYFTRIFQAWWIQKILFPCWTWSSTQQNSIGVHLNSKNFPHFFLYSIVVHYSVNAGNSYNGIKMHRRELKEQKYSKKSMRNKIKCQKMKITFSNEYDNAYDSMFRILLCRNIQR